MWIHLLFLTGFSSHSSVQPGVWGDKPVKTKEQLVRALNLFSGAGYEDQLTAVAV